MKITCDVIKDILPLYIENMVSEDTRQIVKEHIDNCEDCKMQLEKMSSSINLPIDTDIGPLKKLKSDIRKKKFQSIVFTIMLTAVILIALVGFLTTPEYIPYHEGLVSVMENDDGTAIALFSDEVTGYDIDVNASDKSDGYVYSITTWDSIWNRNILKKTVNNTVLNSDGKKVDSVYYYNTDGSEDILIYGIDQNPSGGIMTLPRLALGYYLMLAIILAVVSGIILFVFRHKEKIRNIMVKVFLLPLSYIIAHIGTKGFSASSYSMVRDFFLILLLAIPIYIVFISAINIIRE